VASTLPPPGRPRGGAVTLAFRHAGGLGLVHPGRLAAAVGFAGCAAAGVLRAVRRAPAATTPRGERATA
jgi:hypothetical protein